MKTKLILTATLTIAALALTQACTVTTVQNTSDGGVTGDGGGGGGDGGKGCSFGEPNDSRETAFPIAAGSSYLDVCLEASQNGDNTDFYSFESPAADKAGGFVTVNLTNVQSTDIVIKAFDAVTNELMPGDFHALSGASLKVWFAVRPARKYTILVEHYVQTNAGTYDMVVGYTKVDDAYETNNTREQATLVTLGSSVDATFLATQGTGVENEQVDWYKMEVAGAPAAVSASVSNVATNADCQVKIYDSSFVEVGVGYAGKGANVNATASKPDLTAGTYYFKVGTWVTAVPVMEEGEPADHLTRKYKFSASVAVP
jgi:hypothetical protein